ncbi:MULTISPECIES: DUF2971 domain-containing protein [unclassified Duganella]|uniref:DUF2971 domain-containing protein n=1 Tax=unclassified Duganella TaxID=2636909 RepID=UPI00088ECA94|nr:MULTISPECIES: DUF2971 domain-containing protein [unclassified Duganella]SDH29022.1 Protein of unknown function [Duganella sp. OV458]SDK37877.1 Protein of unknown function [Duganella sp. OV510]
MKDKQNSNLYRIVKFHHAVEILKGSLHFSHPSKWDDPYETRVKHSHDYAMFAQCWGKKSMSDAMWRIYSQDHLGVRIKTTRAKLNDALTDFVRKNKGYKRRLADVKYEKTPAVRKKTREIVDALNGGWQPTLAADLLFHKREAFDHENEVRALLYCPSIDQAQKDVGLKVPVNGHQLIESIYLDPRAPEALTDALTRYIVDILKFKGTVQKSELYARPKELTVVQEQILNQV